MKDGTCKVCLVVGLFFVAVYQGIRVALMLSCVAGVLFFQHYWFLVGVLLGLILFCRAMSLMEAVVLRVYSFDESSLSFPSLAKGKKRSRLEGVFLAFRLIFVEAFCALLGVILVLGGWSLFRLMFYGTLNPVYGLLFG